jgi:unsaturated chondroitin disaccharide hydrolase
MLLNTLMYLTTISILIIGVVSGTGCIRQAEPDDLLSLIESKLQATIAEVADSNVFPRSTRDDGSWELVHSDDWTSGFFAGCLWYLYEMTGNNYWKQAATKWTESLEKEKNNTGTHDLGFMLFTSFGKGYSLTHDERYKEILLEAARSLASRYDPNVGMIKSWDWSLQWQFPVIIDNLLNLELLFWAANEVDDNKDLYEIAYNHARRTLQDHVRNDGSTYHVVNYDSTTGVIISKATHQGLSDSSTWARGQAWAIYGFTVAYEYTGDIQFYHSANAAIEYYFSNVPTDLIPYWDFNITDESEMQKDVSAAAITMAGLFRLATVSEGEDSARYRNLAIAIMDSLLTSTYFNFESRNGLLKSAVGNFPQNKEVGVSLIYADYYFLEAYRTLALIQNFSNTSR